MQHWQVLSVFFLLETLPSLVASGVVPTINTGIAHREPGVGQVGAGIVEAPYECFRQAFEAFAARLDVR